MKNIEITKEPKFNYLTIETRLKFSNKFLSLMKEKVKNKQHSEFAIRSILNEMFLEFEKELKEYKEYLGYCAYKKPNQDE